MAHVPFLKFFYVRYVLVGLAFCIVVLSTWFSSSLVHDIAKEEHQKMELWAEATRKMASADENTDYAFLLQVLENNTSIPCFIVDDAHQVLSYRNIVLPVFDKGKVNEKEFWEHKMRKFGNLNEPIAIHIDAHTTHYIYYDNSLLLKQLSFYPYIQWCLIFIFFFLVLFFMSAAKKAEQNHVWVGLSKETAHQLGTPLSSLMAWMEYFKAANIATDVLPEMEKDVNRLQVIAERFSKVGSEPELSLICLNDVLDSSLGYMRKRVSSKVPINLVYQVSQPIFLQLNVPLFGWVVENLCKNAVDAMNGIGHIDVCVGLLPEKHKVFVDVSDTGKGIPKSNFKTVFSPGFTTKKRGWGLGLSLVKRIVEEYHHGSIFVKHSELNHGTTFRILLDLPAD